MSPSSLGKVVANDGATPERGVIGCLGFHCFMNERHGFVRWGHMPLVSRLRRILFATSIAYISVSLLCVLANALWVADAYSADLPGCYRDNFIVIAVDCRGFAAAAAAGWLLSLPWWQIQVWYFLAMQFPRAFTHPQMALYLLACATLLWAPVGYVAWVVVKWTRGT